MKQKFSISDCTLRDAKNAPGIFLNDQQCINIAKILSKIGIDEIEAGIANCSDSERNILSNVSKIVPSRTRVTAAFFCLNSSYIEKSIKFVIDTGCSGIFISIPCSDIFIEKKLTRSKRATLSLLAKAVSYAKSRGLYVIFSGEDAARADLEFLLEYINVGREAGADRFRFAESIACLSPSMMKEIISYIISCVKIEIEVVRK